MTVVIFGHLWYYAYLIRNKLLEQVRTDYVLLAKSKGLSKRKVIFGHCLRNIMPTYFSLMAISVPHILGGTYIVETVFSYPGNRTLSMSARYHDYNLLMLLCMITGALVIFCNLLAQVINEQIDPRTKAPGGHGICGGEPIVNESAFTLVGIQPELAEATAGQPARRRRPIVSIILLSLIILGCSACQSHYDKGSIIFGSGHYTQAPNREFWFGTDTLGRDIFSMIWYGGRISLFIGGLATIISTVIAVVTARSVGSLRIGGIPSSCALQKFY